jgi:hypothetical protein
MKARISKMVLKLMQAIVSHRASISWPPAALVRQERGRGVRELGIGTPF